MSMKIDCERIGQIEAVSVNTEVWTLGTGINAPKLGTRKLAVNTLVSKWKATQKALDEYTEKNDLTYSRRQAIEAFVSIFPLRCVKISLRRLP